MTREDLKAGLSDQVFGEDSKASDNNASVTKVDFGIFKQDHSEVEESFQNTPDDGFGNFDTFQQPEEVTQKQIVEAPFSVDNPAPKLQNQEQEENDGFGDFGAFEQTEDDKKEVEDDGFGDFGDFDQPGSGENMDIWDQVPTSSGAKIEESDSAEPVIEDVPYSGNTERNMQDEEQKSFEEEKENIAEVLEQEPPQPKIPLNENSLLSGFMSEFTFQPPQKLPERNERSNSVTSGQDVQS